jgi:hypothetical protein
LEIEQDDVAACPCERGLERREGIYLGNDLYIRVQQQH